MKKVIHIITATFVTFTFFTLALAMSCLPTHAQIASTNTTKLHLHHCAEADLGAPPSTNDLECGVLNVAENPQAPDGRRIDLNIVRVPAISANAKADALFILAGGPGQAATQIRDAVRPLTARISQQRDVVFIDQRGTGKSNGLNCDGEEAQDYSLTEAEALAQLQQQLKKCFAQYDADPQFYTTLAAVNDVDLVRKALDYQQINLWGISYGTRAALVYAREFPETVRTLTLDGIAPLELSLPQHLTEDANAAMDLLLTECANQSACATRFGDLHQKLRRLISELDASPKHIEVVHPVTLKKVDVVLSGYVVSNYLRAVLYSRELSPLIPLIIDAISQQDYRPLAGMLALTENMAGDMSEGMHYLVLCSEDFPRAKSVTPAANTLLNLGSQAVYKTMCAQVPTAKVDADYFVMPELSQPTLILSGQFDPVTPLRWGEQALQYLPNAQHLVVPGTHHGSSFAGCMPRVINEFIDEGSATDLTTDCIANIKPLAMFVSPAGPSMKKSMKKGNQNISKEEKNEDEAAQ